MLICIQIARVVPAPLCGQSTNTLNTSQDEVMDNSLGSEMLTDEYHVCGDIVQVRNVSSYMGCQANLYTLQLFPCTGDVIHHSPYISVSGAVVNINRAQGFFKCNALQYMTFFKDHWHLSMLPIRAHFNNTHYKNKKPLPSNNSYIAVKGFLNQIIFNPNTGQPLFFQISAKNISFLGKVPLANSPVASKGM